MILYVQQQISNMYKIISRNRISEPYRGQNYSEFYFTTYIEVEYDNGDIKTFSFYEESEEEIDEIIKNGNILL